MKEIVIEDVKKTYANTIALKEISIKFPSNSFTAVLGPSGCGKTTLMRVIAGLIKPDSGRIYFGDKDVTNLPPQDRGTAMVFQNYALWPHMTVFQNIAYGLKLKKYPEREIKNKVKEILGLVGLSDLENRYPSQLSGGQQQRVALARALVVNPDVLLLDEPLSNLDAKVRQYLRVEIRKLHKLTGITTIYVTHDQEEAMAVADQVVVMRSGSVEQIGTPEQIYKNPANLFVADFLGVTNILTVNKNNNIMMGKFLTSERFDIETTTYNLVFRSTDATLQQLCNEKSNDAVILNGKVEDVLYLGAVYRHYIKVGENIVIVDGNQIYMPDKSVFVVVPINLLHIFPLEENKLNGSKYILS